MDALNSAVHLDGLTPTPGPAAPRDIIVVGASAGGLRALMFLLARFSRTSLAFFFVVVHVFAEQADRMPGLLQRASQMLTGEDDF